MQNKLNSNQERYRTASRYIVPERALCLFVICNDFIYMSFSLNARNRFAVEKAASELEDDSHV